MKKIRLSYSLLSLWEKGLYDEAVSTYFHLDKPISKQMEDGKRIHKEIEEHIKNLNSFPSYLINHILTVPETEKEVVVSYNEMFNLKGIYDCYDVPLIFEFKTGVQDSLEWLRTCQASIYFLLAELAKIEADSLYLIRFNQYTATTDFAIVHNSKKLRDKAKNYIDTIGPEVYSHFEREGLI